MAWTSLNEEASGYYQCLSVYQAGTGVSHPSGQVYRAGVQQRHYRGWIRFKDLLWLSVGWYPFASFGELVLLACLVRLRSDAGQWQVCLTGDSDWFDNAPAASLYNGFPRIGTMLTASRYQNQIIRWLLRPLPGDMSDFWLLTARELSVLKILMQGMSFSEIARYEQRSSKTLHAIATRALMKLDWELWAISGCSIRDAVTAEWNGIYGYMQDMSDNIPLIDSLSMCRTWYPEFFIQRKLPLVNQ